MNPRARGDERGEPPIANQHLQHLPRCRIYIEGDAGRNRSPPDDFRDDGEVPPSRIGGGADVRLRDFRALDISDGDDLAGTRRLGDKRFEFGKIDVVVLVIAAAQVRLQFAPVLLPSLRFQKCPRRFVGRKNGGGRAKLRAHIGDHMPVHRREVKQARAMVFDNLADAAGDAVTAQHFEDHVLGADPIRRRAGQLHSEHRRHCRRIGIARHREGDIEPAGADRQHAQRAGGGRVTVGPKQRFAGTPEAFHVNDVTDAVAWPRIPYPISSTGAFEEEVVLGVQIVDLQQVVIDVLNADFCFDTLQSHRLER